ncbi:DNA-binding domain-containing protein [Primorskyibacter flagellatus]|uniref:Putative DNA-binding domain-containing protein n=1 Tax=Primorskyibacter flagellatus TaxID=1387277 RepID=A0A1W2BKY9_9RHOB|nr:DNA-binding domain-containing protein [Primorskyibacter flagellatus]SMC73625.1 Putative DNA-binding domain-containing protein [Primorskyibacter flagellatus]
MTEQHSFRAPLLDADRAIPEGLTDGLGRPAGARYNVYRNNVAVSLTEALETGFPAIAKLIGPDNFRAVAARYLRAAPPTSPLMMHYGAGFPEFLKTVEPLAHLGYLPDVARLELALRRSFHAADHTPADPALLQDVDDDALMSCRMALAPSAHLLRSPWPIVSIWAFNMRPGSAKPQARPEDALILRAEFDPEPLVTPEGGAAFVTALIRGESFGSAMTAAGDSFDVGVMLNLLFTHRAIAGISFEDTP